MNDAIEQLCQKWIAEESIMRTKANDLFSIGSVSTAMLVNEKANMFSNCRRELQEAAGLVVKPENL